MQAAGLTFRVATRDDLPDLLALYQQLESQTSSVTLERLEKTFGRLENYPDYKVYVAREGNVAVGTFALVIMDTLGERCAPAGIIEDVVVARSARGKGIGRRMMELALERCREAGCYKAVLSSNLRREEAHLFYESLGFRKHGYSFAIEL